MFAYVCERMRGFGTTEVERENEKIERMRKNKESATRTDDRMVP
jgi:hypothetical protein